MPGVSGVFFGALGNAGLTFSPSRRGATSATSRLWCMPRMLYFRAVHAAFWLSALGLSIGIVGTGRGGSAAIQSLPEQVDIMETRYQIKVDIRGVINSRNMILGEDLSGSDGVLARDHAQRRLSKPPSRTFSSQGSRLKWMDGRGLGLGIGEKLSL